MYFRFQSPACVRQSCSFSVVLLTWAFLFGGASGQTAYPATPFLSPAAGTYATGRTVTITDATSGSAIHYTTDGTAPTANSPVYKAPISIPTAPVSETIRAIATKGNLTGSSTSATFNIIPQLPTPSFSPAEGYYMSGQQIALSGSPLAGPIHYTLDGTVPSVASPIYTGAPIPVFRLTIISAFAAAAGGYRQSNAVTQIYRIIPATPYISPAAGTYTTGRTITLSDSTAGSLLFYTADGSAPTPRSALYTGPFNIPTKAVTETVRVLAVLDGVYSSLSSSTFTIAPQSVTPTPGIVPATGTFSTNPLVTMTDAVAGAQIYYTINGSSPTQQSTQYTGPFYLPQAKTGKVVIQAIAYKSGSLLSAIFQANLNLTLPAGVIATAVVDATVAPATIPKGYLGYSHEWGRAQSMMGQKSTVVNTIYRKFATLLSTNMGGPLSIRIGGGSTDTSGTASASTVEPLVELAAAENVSFILGVNLGSDNLQLAEEQAAVYKSVLPPNSLTAFEIGNEPDGYSANGIRSANYSFCEYLPEYEAWRSGILALSGTPVGIAGPAFGTGNWISNAQASVAGGLLQATLVTQHKYLACYNPAAPLATNILLQPTSATASMQYFRPYVAAAHAQKESFRLDELNSICLGGQPGVSNSFSSALWAVDTMFEYASIGVDGVNWHSDDDGGAYDLFHFTSITNGQYYLLGVNPLFYGLLFFSQAAGNNAQLLAPIVLTNANIKVWITKDNAGTAHLVVLNKEPEISGSVQITLSGYSSGTVSALTAPNYLSTTGVTIAGQTFDGSTDGSLVGTASTASIQPNGAVWTVPVGPMSAVSALLHP